jgi:hypothetical protein
VAGNLQVSSPLTRRYRHHAGAQQPRSGGDAAKVGIGLFGLGMFISSMTFVNAYIAKARFPPAAPSAFGTVIRRLGLSRLLPHSCFSSSASHLRQQRSDIDTDPRVVIFSDLCVAALSRLRHATTLR